MSSITELNDGTFSEAIGQGITLVDFWAPWCAPCIFQGPILEQVAAKVGEMAKIAKLNVDEGRQTAASLDIRAIPTLILFKDGKPVQQFVGIQMEEALVRAIEAAQEA
ncbi:MAG: thioredoxin [Phycisphaerae bacterium]|nr:thioredoxin [Phycisphaerae bacterium]